MSVPHFVVRQANGTEAVFPTVAKAFSEGGAKPQGATVRAPDYPAAYVKDDEGRYYGPVLRP